MSKQRLLKPFFFILLSITTIYGQTEISLDTPRIYEGNVTNDSIFSNPISIESRYSGEEPFMGMDKQAYYSLNALNAIPLWNPASIEEKKVNHDFSLIDDMHQVESSCSRGFDDGRFIIVWKTLNTSGIQSIYFQLFNAEGEKIGNEIPANVANNKRRISATKPDIAVLNNGHFIIAWDGMDNNSDHQYRVFGRRFDMNGNPLDNSEFEINHEITYNNNFNPSLIATEKNIISVWSSRKTEGGDASRIEAMRYDYDGHPIGRKVVLVEENTNYYFMYPQITKLNDQEFILIWGQVNTGLFIQKVILTDNVLKLIEPKVTLTTESPQQKSLKVEALENNGFIATWSQSTGRGVRLYGRHFNNNCEAVGSPFQIDNHSDNTSSMFPHTTALDDGGFLVCWRDYNFSQMKGSVMIKRYNAASSLMYQAVVAEKNTEIAAFSACATGKKNLLTVWADKINRDTYRRKAAYYPSKKRAYTPGAISPAGDIDIKFKLVDPATSEEWLSPVRSYLNAVPGEGSDSRISYPGGFTNKNQVKVQITLGEGRYKSIEFFMQKALVENNQVGSFGDWEAYGTITTQTEIMDVLLEDRYAYRFKYDITNMSDTTYEIIGDSVLIYDGSGPELRVESNEPDRGELQVFIEYGDFISGINALSYRINNKNPVTFASGELLLQLDEGPNHIVFIAEDLAGNITTRHLFKTAERVVPAISITGIKEGEEYGDNILFSYTSTVLLNDTGVYIDDVFTDTVNNSIISLDMRDYEEGAHTIAVRGRTSQDIWLEDSVRIFLRHGIFNLILLSPVEGQDYGSKNITIEYWASEPLNEIWFRLDEGEREDSLELTGLENGNHFLEVFATNANNDQVSVSTGFKITEIFPEINIISPTEGQILPGREIELIFETNALVNYELGEYSGEAVSGTIVTVPSDGEYILMLEAIHPVSGNKLRKTVPLMVDSVEPELKIITPESRLYANNEINIDYRVNKVIREVKLYLDGKEVEKLSGLEPGGHRFEVHVFDHAGRQVKKGIDFTVSRLEILQPDDGAKIISETWPPFFSLVYDQEKSFDALTRSIDDREGELITTPPGMGIPMETTAGKHELYLRGYLNEFKIVKRNSFQIGIKNLSVGPGSIDYSYKQISGTENYRVNVTLTVENTGDLDIDEPITVRFDYINQAGYSERYLEEFEGLKSNESAIIELAELAASFGDRFFVTIDPENRLIGEYPGDNSCGIEFQTGQITGITSLLPDENVYLQNVSVFNTLNVDTAGSIAYVELHTNSKVFYDNTPENGFRSIVDMGLLSPERKYVQVFAYGNNDVVLDSRKYYFDIKKLSDNMGGHYFPWSYVAYESSGDYDRINISKVDLEELTYLQGQALVNSSAQPPCVIPIIHEDNSVEYEILSLDISLSHMSGTDEAGVRKSTSNTEKINLTANNDEISPGRASDTIDMGDTPGLGGTREIPNGKAYMNLTSMDPANYICNNEGSYQFNTQDALEYYNETIRNEGEIIIQELAGMISDGLGLEEALSDAMKKVYDSVYNSINFGFGFYITGTITDHSVMKKKLFDVSEPEIEITGEMNYVDNVCDVCNNLQDAVDAFDLEIESTHYGEQEGKVTITVNPREKIHIGGGVRMFIFIPYGYTNSSSIEFEKLTIEKEFIFKSSATKLFYHDKSFFNPVHTVLDETIKPRTQRLLGGEIKGWSIFFTSDSTIFNGTFSLEATARADIINTPTPDLDGYLVPKVFKYAEGRMDVMAEYTTITCFFWGISDKLCVEDGPHNIVDEHYESKTGVDYEKTEVDQYIHDNLQDFVNGE